MFTCCQNHIFVARDCACTCARDGCRQGIERVGKALNVANYDLHLCGHQLEMSLEVDGVLQLRDSDS